MRSHTFHQVQLVWLTSSCSALLLAAPTLASQTPVIEAKSVEAKPVATKPVAAQPSEQKQVEAIDATLVAQPLVVNEPVVQSIAIEPEIDEELAVMQELPGDRLANPALSSPIGSPIQLPTETDQTVLKFGAVDDPRIPADGRSIVELSGQILDAKGNKITQDALVTLTTATGKFIGDDYDPDQVGFQVLATQGEFKAQLQSTVKAGRVRVRAGIDPRLNAVNQKNPDWFYPTQVLEAYTQIEFITSLRPAITTGTLAFRLGADGANYWRSFREFLRPDANGTALDVDAAIFSTGKLGDWRVTTSYNNRRPLNQTCDGRNEVMRNDQLCENRYGVYGDSSNTEYTTPSTDSLFFKLERTSPTLNADPDYVMWGDYGTNELARRSQLFTATTQQLHGLKLNYNVGDLQLTGLYSNSVNGLGRDQITPDGTSGYYFLSNRLVIGGTETIYIETEQLERPGFVVKRQPMYRGSDYEIDYDRGTLLFRRPIQATEYDLFGNTLVRRIVATYQFENNGNNTNFYGGRLQYNFARELSNPSLAGLSYMRSDRGAQDFELYGADLRVPLGKAGQIVGEIARSNNQSPLTGDIDGTAYRLEANTGVADWLKARAYYRSVTENFSNNATTSFTPGQTRYGTELNASVTPSTNLGFSFDFEENYGVAAAPRLTFFDIFNPQPTATPGSAVNNTLTTIRAGIAQQLGASTASLEYVSRDREDRIGNTFTGDTEQLVSRLNVPMSPSLTFLAQNELNLQNANDPLYPNRTTLGLDWKAFPGISLRLAHQFLEGGLFGGNSITSLGTLLDYKLSEDASVTGRYTLLGGTNGVLGQGAVGLKYRWAVAPGLRMNLGYERIFGSVVGGTAAGNQFLQPYAVGQTASSLGLLSGDSYNIGFDYTENPDFKASARLEHRDSSAGSNTVISAAADGRVSSSLTALFRYQKANAANQLISGLGDTTKLRLGLAYRNPDRDDWNALLRYEYRRNPSTIPDTLLLGSGTGSREHLFAFETIYEPDPKWEFYGKYAYRSSTSRLASNFVNNSAIHLAQLRAAYQFDYHWDIAAEGRLIAQPTANYNETGFAVELGYYPSPDLRFFLGYSFGRADDEDFTGTRSRGGPYIGVGLKVNELFNGFGRQSLPPVKTAQTNEPQDSNAAQAQPEKVTALKTPQSPQPIDVTRPQTDKLATPETTVESPPKTIPKRY
ncbi:hypothetical protein IQ266_08885 [filamentous cyanobacterium LEGE 11480]|uniref:TonB-dependent receptor n=1 Tax=Romeriopsis navalis LEGE 11480 TaxID=2777977 RepID=A0A928VNV7_9CYAN|nr:TonB-dependent receptor [Romeriopsis navalis]MBE9029842.1 hypothetical protein [Romeriopsis navalis LEGE 11480]